jgi:hypothetical protein
MQLEVDVPSVSGDFGAFGMFMVNDVGLAIYGFEDMQSHSGFIVSCLNFLWGVYFRNFPDPNEVI